ncbi:MAG: hypothetical protein ACRDTU_12145 [Micromonosporaceae bacterium]
MSDPTPASSTPVSRGWTLWGWVSAVLLIMAAIVVAGAPQEPESVAHVRAYLTAIREGQAAEALKLAGVSKPSGERGRFLTPKALTGDWEIVALRESLHLDSFGPEEARVEVAIRAGGATAVSELSLVKQGDDWTIEDPLLEVTFPPTRMLYADVNGVRVPTDLVPTTETVYELLPGGYQFYSDIPGVAKVASKTVPLLPGYAAVPPDLAPAVTLTRRGERAARAAVKKYIDACARKPELAPEDCPFGADTAIGPQRGEYRSLSDFREISWKVERYPEVAVISSGLGLADRQRGSVEVAVTATEGDSKKVRFSVTCEMRMNDYSLVIAADGTLRVLPPYGRNSDRESVIRVDTCRQ